MTLTWKQRLKAFFSGKLEIAPERIEIPTVPPNVVGSWSGYTLDIWQSDKHHIEWMQRMFKDDVYFKDMINVLVNATPIFSMRDLDSTAASIALGKFLGMREVLAILHSMAMYPRVPQGTVEPDYQAENGDFLEYKIKEQ